MTLTDDFFRREYFKYYGENKVGRCAEVLYDYNQCMKRAIDQERECALILQDLDECTHQRKQRAVLEAFEQEKHREDPLMVKLWNFLTR